MHLGSIKYHMHTLLFGKWKFHVTCWRKCVSLSYCGFFRTAQLGRISTRHHAGEMEFPVLEEEDLSQCCCDLIFFWLTSWVTITDMSNMPFIYHHLLVGMEMIMPYLPEQLASQLTLVCICGKHFSCTSSLFTWRCPFFLGKNVVMTGRWVHGFWKGFGVFCTNFSAKNINRVQMCVDVY